MTFRKLRLLMSKYGFSILFMGFELWASFAAFFWLNRWFPHWLSVAVIGLLYVSTILAIVNRNTPPENKVTWLLIAVIPVFGSLLYLMFGERRLSKKEMIQLKNMESMKFREDNSHQLRKELKQESKAVYGLVKSILSMDHNADLYNGTASTFYPLGEEMYEQLLEDLKAAKKFIFIEFYIIDEGLMWNSILEILEQKVKDGVEVKLLYDDIGCMATLAGNYTKRLRKMGIDAHKFNKVIPRLTVAYNNRDHRKILVIDGQIGYTGGVNLADEYINRRERFGHWKDSAILLEGDAVWSMTVMFLTMWDHCCGWEEEFRHFRPEPSAVRPWTGYVQPYTDTPLDRETVGQAVYLNMISKARKYIYITTPYLVIDVATNTALCNAAKSGVDVRIITPHIPDKRYVFEVTRAHET